MIDKIFKVQGKNLQNYIPSLYYKSLVCIAFVPYMHTWVLFGSHLYFLPCIPNNTRYTHNLHSIFLHDFSHGASICVQSATITLTQITKQTKIK